MKGVAMAIFCCDCFPPVLQSPVASHDSSLTTSTFVRRETTALPIDSEVYLLLLPDVLDNSDAQLIAQLRVFTIWNG